MKCLHLSALFALSTVLGGCTFSYAGTGAADEPNDGPTVQVLESPLSVTARDGVYEIPLTLLLTDPEGQKVTRIRYRVRSHGIDVTGDAPAFELDDATRWVVLRVDDRAPRQTYDVLLSAFDVSGLEGPPVVVPITLE